VEPSPRSTAASRRSRREAPGTVTQSSQDGGAAVSISKRKTKPGKQAKVATPKKEVAGAAAASDVEIRVDVDGKQELLNPDEERYCICGDVSWGEMICCELDEKVRHVPQVWLSFANSKSSASMANGFIWSAFSFLSYRRGRWNGIVPVTGRSSKRARTPTGWWAGVSNEVVSICVTLQVIIEISRILRWSHKPDCLTSSYINITIWTSTAANSWFPDSALLLLYRFINIPWFTPGLTSAHLGADSGSMEMCIEDDLDRTATR